MTPTLRSALAASGYVGIWETNLATQTVELTGTLPDLLGLDVQSAAAGVPVAAFLDGVHSEDRARVAHLVEEAHRTAGRFEAEFRTRDRHGEAHWVSARGRVEVDADGNGLRCLGVVLDLTDSRGEDPMSQARPTSAIDRIVNALLAIRPLAQEIDSPILRTLIDASLIELGKLLAGQVGRSAPHLH